MNRAVAEGLCVLILAGAAVRGVAAAEAAPPPGIPVMRL